MQAGRALDPDKTVSPEIAGLNHHKLAPCLGLDPRAKRQSRLDMGEVCKCHFLWRQGLSDEIYP